MFLCSLILGSIYHRFDPRTIRFSGFDWQVKASESPVGPGPNVFSGTRESVFVDARGHLHLKASKTGGRWTCSELYLPRSLGYGRYEFEIASPAESIDPNLVLGLFTYGEQETYHHREIDVEISRWSDAKNDDAQFVVQPSEQSGNIVRFEVPHESSPFICSFDWKPTGVSFLAKSGTWTKSWNYIGPDIPRPGDETVHLNLWLFQGKPPITNKPSEVIVNRFRFVGFGNQPIGRDLILKSESQRSAHSKFQ